MRWYRKLTKVTGVVVMAAGLLFSAAPAAHSVTPTFDVTHDLVQCHDLIGKITFSPPLKNGGAVTALQTIHAKSDDCTDLNGSPVTLKGMTVTGSTTLASNDCSQSFVSGTGALAGTPGLSLAVKWSTAPTSPNKLTSTTSSVAVSQMWTGAFGDFGQTTPGLDADSFASEYGEFVFGTSFGQGAAETLTASPAVSGDFQGTDGGQASTMRVTSTESSTALRNLCLGAGIKTVTLGIGSVLLG